MEQKAGPAKARRRALVRSEILTAALRLIDRDGLEGLNMRALGQELGVRGMSLYHHVSGKDVILDGVVELIFKELELPSKPEKWDRALKAGFVAFRRVLLAHPAAVPLFLARTVSSPEALALVERSLRTLREAGFDDVAAIDGHRVLMTFTTGYAMSEVSLLGEPVDPNAWGTAAYGLRDLPGESVPHLAAVASKALARRPDDQFESCLDTIIAGLAARLDGHGGHRRRQSARP